MQQTKRLPIILTGVAICLLAAGCHRERTIRATYDGRPCAQPMIMVPAVATHALPAVTTVTPAAPVAPDRTPWTAAVYFETDATAFSQMTLVRLERNAGILLRRPKIRVAISGAADPRGDAVYNRELGLRRAAAVRDFFVSKGVDPARLHVMSSELVLSPEENATADQLAADRRVDLRALYFDGRPMNHFLDD